MARQARIVIPGIPHHVTQRGTGGEDVFRIRRDYEMYLELLARHAEASGMRVPGYCLMRNHVHIVAMPAVETSLARVLRDTHSRYGQWLNWRHSRVGHVWQGRYYSCPMDEGHTPAAMRYVERNPVRAGIVTEPWHYEWSSARAHVGGRDLTGMLDLERWSGRWPPADWREFLRTPEDAAGLELLRTGTAGGWPLGSHEFIADLERRLGRRLRPRPVGRPGS
jgi:putative transposase